MPLKLTTYYQGSEIPDFPRTNTFHSKELFQIYEETGATPASGWLRKTENLLRDCLLPSAKASACFLPLSSNECEIYGTGEYLIAEADKERIFGEKMLTPHHGGFAELVSTIEFRNLENAMFGYKYFRSNRYFPVNWLRAMKLASRHRKRRTAFQPLRIRQIKKGLKNGAKVDEARTVEEIRYLEYAEASLFVPHP